ncbi:ABC transporter ATP-binding protein [Halobaculum sp. D14]|uniref:ABC transporter ATP-binding protein n=1 Tax=Halobaculum sp. D14 TaxID=3421642 RepID=UPI003EC06E0C
MGSLSLDAVEKRYAETAALDGVSLAVEEGEFFTLVGPSGCGKTTTLRVIAGLEPPTAGTVRFGGDDVADVPTEERGVGIVFQNYALFPHMTVRENVAYGLRFHDPPADQSVDERVADLLDVVDLAGMGGREPDQLSGGQQQRVALARALAPQPEVLLLDEPMSALDARLREELRRQVKSIQAELGVTTVYVTHDQAEALAVSDRVAVMNDGRVEQVGTPREVYREPATQFVASFVGENNRFAGVVTGADGADRDGGEPRPTFTVDVDGTSFRVAADRVDGDSDGDTAPSVGDDVVFYVRPEALDPAASDNRFTVAVETTEFLGEATRLHGAWRGRDVVVRGDPDADVDVDELAVGFAPSDAVVVAQD